MRRNDHERRAPAAVHILRIAGIVCLLLSRLADGAWLKLSPEGLPVLGTLSTLAGYSIFLWLLIRAEDRRELTASALCFVIGFALRCFGFFDSGAADLLIFGLAGCLAVLPFLLSRLAFRRKLKGGVLVFPLAWMSLFAAGSLLGMSGPFRLELYLFGCKPLLQGAAWIGASGLCFLLAAAASALAALFMKETRRQGCRAALVLLGLWGCLFGLGTLRLARAPKEGPTLRTAFAAGTYCGDFMTAEDLPLAEDLACLEQTAREAKAQKAELLLFSEEAFELPAEDRESFMSRARALAKELELPMVLGLELIGGEGEKGDNCLVLIDSRGQELIHYSKYCLVPLIESGQYIRGDGELPVFALETEAGTVRLAMAICYDSNFSYYVAGMADDADILLLPSWDWDGITGQHFRIAGMLGPENGVSVLKATYDGLTLAEDAYGRELLLEHSESLGYGHAVTLELPAEGTRTLYGAVGSWLLWIYPAALLLWFGLLWGKKRSEARVQ